MKVLRTSLVLISMVLLSLFAPLSIHAYNPLEDTCKNSAQGTDFCSNATADEKRTIVYGNNNIFVKIVQTIILLTAAISVVMIIIGGLRYIFSAGDPGSTKGAKDTILYAVVGLVVVIFAQVIVAFVLSRFK